jgi:F0F1-type ATP synthase membrane subunit b/b'
MSRIVRNTAMLALVALAAQAAEAGGHGDGDPYLHYKLVNFGILAAGIGFLVVKLLFPAFRKQQKEILDGMAQAERKAEEAKAEAAVIESRMAGLEQDVAGLKQRAAAEMEHERERLERETAAQLAKIASAAEVEIGSMTKAARQELKVYSAELALELAKQMIRSRLDDAAQSALIARFAAGLTPDVVDKN